MRAGEKGIPPRPGAVRLECNQRFLPGAAVSLVPEVVCYRPLYFEDRNTERYGWRIPVVQPLVSAGKFYADTLLLPVKLVVEPPWQWECDPGFPKPGDPVPYRLCPYPLGSHGDGRQESGTCSREADSGN